jgi:hypothetical protein
MVSHRIPVNSPEAQMAPGGDGAAWLMATVPMAFMGWMGMGRPEVEAGHDLEDAEGDEHADRVELGDGEVSDEERDESAEVAESAGGLAYIVVVSPEPHRGSRRNRHGD